MTELALRATLDSNDFFRPFKSSDGTTFMSAMLLAQQILNGLLDGVYYLLIA